MLNLLQDKINSDFDYAHDVIDIQKLDRDTLKSIENLHVRVTKAIRTKNTNLNYSEDDFRNIIFQDINYKPNWGDIFYFENYYWIAINTDNINSPTASVDVRKSNYSYKWIDSNGDYRWIPGFITHKSNLSSGIDEVTEMIVADGEKIVVIPTTEETLKIKRDSRIFISKDNINNPLSYKIVNIDNMILDGLIMFKVQEQGAGIDYSNDNLELGICDCKNRLATYKLEILNGTNLQQYINQSLQLNLKYTKTINNQTTVITPLPEIIYKSSDENIAQIDNNGLINFVGTGNISIICIIKDRPDVSTRIQLEVVPIQKDNYVIDMPVVDLYIGQTKTFSATLLNNGQKTTNAKFDFIIDNGVTPSNAYIVTTTDTSITIKNNKNPYSITVNCYWRDNHSIMVTKVIKLRGFN